MYDTDEVYNFWNIYYIGLINASPRHCEMADIFNGTKSNKSRKKDVYVNFVLGRLLDW